MDKNILDACLGLNIRLHMVSIASEENKEEDPENKTRDTIESAMKKRAEQIISIKKLKCKHCVFVKKVKNLPAFCAAGKRDVFGDEPACVEINPTQETIDTMGEIKLNQDGEVIE